MEFLIEQGGFWLALITFLFMVAIVANLVLPHQER